MGTKGKSTKQTINQTLFYTDSMAENQKKVAEKGSDATVDPHGEKRWALNGNTKDGSGKTTFENIIVLNPAQNIIPIDELYRASMTPKGAYITRVSTRLAFYNGWKHVSAKRTKDPLEDSLANRLDEMTAQYQLKRIFTQMVRTGKIYGRSLVFKQKDSRKLPGKDLFLRVSIIQDQDIDWDQEKGFPTMYHPTVNWGMGNKRLDIKPEDAVMYVWDLDEAGNLFQGVPELVTVFNTIVRNEAVSDEVATTVAERGLGFVDVLDNLAKDLNDLKKVRQNFKLGKDRVFVHGKQYEAKVTQGVQSSMDFVGIMGQYTKDTSSGTGYPGMAMEGVQAGAVTGSETDQDNRAQMYRITQENSEDAMKEVYYLLDPTLRTQIWEYDWDFEIKQDRAKKAQTLSTFAMAITTCQDLIKVDQALNLLEMPTFGPEDGGDLLVSEWIAINSPLMNTARGPNDQNFTNQGWKTKRDLPQEDLPYPDDAEKEKWIEEAESKDHTGEEQKAEKETDDLLKEEVARRLLAKQFGYNQVNFMLNRIFDSGMSNTTLQKHKKTIT